MEKVEVMLKSGGKWISIEEAERKGWVKAVRCSICGNIAGFIDKTRGTEVEVKEINLRGGGPRCAGFSCRGIPPIKGKQLKGLKEALGEMPRFCPWCGAPITMLKLGAER